MHLDPYMTSRYLSVVATFFANFLHNSATNMEEIENLLDDLYRHLPSNSVCGISATILVKNCFLELSIQGEDSF